MLNLLQQYVTEHNITLKEEDFPSTEAFLFHYAEYKDYDILLLDIEMANMDFCCPRWFFRPPIPTIRPIKRTGYPQI